MRRIATGFTFTLAAMKLDMAFSSLKETSKSKRGKMLASDDDAAAIVSADGESPSRIVAHRASAHSMETLSAPTPVLVSVEAVSSEDQVPTMKQMLAARKAPLVKLEAEAMPESGVTVVSTTKAPLKQAHLLEGDVDQASNALIQTLRAEGVLQNP